MSENIEKLIADSVEKPQDSVRDNSIVAELREMKAQTAFLCGILALVNYCHKYEF